MSQPAKLALTTVRVLTILALLASSYAHWRLAHTYDPVGKGHLITQGRLFRLQGTAAALAALLLIVNASIIGWGFAFGVIGASVAAIFTYRYVNVGKIGPIPNMYEPTWSSIKELGIGLKPLSAVAGIVGTVGAAIGISSKLAKR